MLIFTDAFSFNAVCIGSNLKSIKMDVVSIKDSDLKDTLKMLMNSYGDIKSLLITKKAVEEFKKETGLDLTLFTSKLFSRNDFMKINKANAIIYREKDKENNTVSWYLITAVD